MSGKYRGVLKVTGSTLKGWLIDVARPARRVRFNLVIDGETRGSFVANARRRFFVPRQGAEEDTHGFSIPIRRPWITGTMQDIRFEDPADPDLAVALTAKLGPRAHEHFAEHVHGGHVSIGGQDGRARAADEDDEARPASVNRALLRQIGTLGDAELIALIVALERDVVLERVRRYDKTGDWESLAPFRRAIAGGSAEQLLMALGRGAMKAHNHALAGRVTAAAAAMHPGSFETNYLAGAAKSLHGEFDEAMRYLRAADLLEEGGHQAKREMAIVLQRQLRQDLSIERREAIRTEHLAVLRALAIAPDMGTQVKYRVPYATALYAAGRYDEAIEAANVVLATAPNDTRALMVKARALVARNAIGEAHALYERVLDLDPGHRGAQLNLRILAALVEDEAREHEGEKVGVVHHRNLDAALAGPAREWVCVSDTDLSEDELSRRLAPQVGRVRRLGHVELKGLEFWRRDALVGLRESGLIESPRDARRYRHLYGQRMNGYGGGHGARRGIAVLASRNGADLYGGGEHFLEDAAEHHARQGYEVVILGTRADLEGQEKVVGGRRAVFIGEEPADLRRFLVENDVALVHAISGLGFAVSEALNYTNIPFIYGVHFWNELLGDPERSGYFDDVSGSALFRREFLVILSRATTVYANSRYTQKLIEDGFGVRCPILYASPKDLAPA